MHNYTSQHDITQAATATNFAAIGIILPPGRSGEVRATCPQCAGSSKKKNLSANTHLGVFHCHKCGWRGRLGSDGAERDPVEVARRAEEETARKRAEQQDAARKAREEWDSLAEQGRHEYLLRKKVGAHGVRFGADERGPFVAMPLRKNGAIVAIQRVYPDGAKRTSSRADTQGAHLVIGEPGASGTIYLAEGYATAASVHEATAAAAVITFGASNLPLVARHLQQKYPNHALVVAADNDEAGLKAARACARAKVAIPEFSDAEIAAWSQTHDGKPPTDFNDLHAMRGLEAVRASVTLEPVNLDTDEILAARCGVGPEPELPEPPEPEPELDIAALPPAHGEPETTTGAAEARQELAAKVAEFFDRARDDDAPSVAIKAPAGIGKTAIVAAEASARRGLVGNIFVPSHKLGAEQLARYPAGHATVIRGRTHATHDMPPLCPKAEAVELMSRAGHANAVRTALCGIDVNCGELTVGCGEFGRGNCKYYRQFNDPAPIRIYSHDWLTLPPSDGIKHANKRVPDFNVIDENFTQTAVKKKSWTTEKIIGDEPQGGIWHAALAAASSGDMAPIATRIDELDAELEKDQAEKIPVHPKMSPAESVQALEGWSPARRPFGFLRAVRAIATGTANPNQMWVSTADDKTRVHFASIQPLPFLAGRPTLAIDATPNPALIEKTICAKVQDLPARRNATIVQVCDHTLSHATVIGDGRTDENGNEIADPSAEKLGWRLAEFVWRQYRANPAGAVIAPKAWIERWRDELPPVPLAWFGGLRGLNAMAGAEWLVQISWNQPTAFAVESLARAIHPDQCSTLSGKYERQVVRLEDKAGAAAAVARWVHPNPAAHEMLQNIREAESIQALDRLRLINDAAKKTVFVFCNLPLPGARPDRIVRLGDVLLPHKLARAAIRDGIVPLGHTVLAERYPDLFPTVNEAHNNIKKWRQKIKGPNAICMYIAFGPFIPNNPLTTALRIIYYRTQGGRGKPAIAIAHPGTPASEVLAAMHGKRADIIEETTLGQHLARRAGHPAQTPAQPTAAPEPAAPAEEDIDMKALELELEWDRECAAIQAAKAQQAAQAATPAPAPAQTPAAPAERPQAAQAATPAPAPAQTPAAPAERPQAAQAATPAPAQANRAPLPFSERIVLALAASDTTLSQSQICIAVGSSPHAAIAGVLDLMRKRGAIVASGRGFTVPR